MLSRVPWMASVGLSCAAPGASGEASASSPIMTSLILIIPPGQDAPTLSRPGRAQRRPLPASGPAARHELVDEEDEDRAHDRGDEAGPFAGPVPAQLLAEEAGDDRAGNAEQNG